MESPDQGKLVPLTFEDVQDERGDDLLLARDLAQMTEEERTRSRGNIQRLVARLRATARPIRQSSDG